MSLPPKTPPESDAEKALAALGLWPLPERSKDYVQQVERLRALQIFLLMINLERTDLFDDALKACSLMSEIIPENVAAIKTGAFQQKLFRINRAGYPVLTELGNLVLMEIETAGHSLEIIKQLNNTFGLSHKEILERRPELAPWITGYIPPPTKPTLEQG